MAIHELVTLTLKPGVIRAPGRLDQVLSAVTDFTAATGGVTGSWTAEFGPQNRVLLLRVFPDIGAMHTERQRVLRCAEPFIPSELLAGLRFDSYVPFDGLAPLRPGAYGPYYEFRTYVLRTGGLAPTMAAWAQAIPGRIQLSPLVTAMYSLDGEPRFIHVWGYRDLASRERIRHQAFATGVWPAPGAPGHLTERLATELYVPTAASRLT